MEVNLEEIKGSRWRRTRRIEYTACARYHWKIPRIHLAVCRHRGSLIMILVLWWERVDVKGVSRDGRSAFGGTKY